MLPNHHPLPIKDRVYEELKQRILKLSLKPGQALSEKEIAEHLHVSRTPVREAFIRLAGDQLVRILPQRGTYVSKISLSAVRESCFIREALEVAAMLRAIAVWKQDDGNQLRLIVEEQAACIRSHDYTSFYMLDERFHQTLSVVSGFPATWDVVRSVKLQMDRGRYLSMSIGNRLTTIVDQHQSIFDAMLAKDSSLAERRMREHIQETCRYIESLGAQFPEFFTG
ncbi:GntR family transcriptional regulator [Paenibacillus cymbidii]|uniref:GntR family transcriptional regulator n=1 Tax=Paenibacillus cymbidii TaxID=1639034 RepID=UPI0010814667|nr:GntR family transcriptional regulator [Paenibacillus cymbidii]